MTLFQQILSCFTLPGERICKSYLLFKAKCGIRAVLKEGFLLVELGLVGLGVRKSFMKEGAFELGP